MILLVGVLATPALAASPPWDVKAGPPPRYPEILVSARWLRTQGRDRSITVVDARSATSFQREHIPGSI